MPKLTEQSNEDRGRTGEETGEETGQAHGPYGPHRPGPARRQGQLAGAAAAAGQDRPWEAGKVLTGNWNLTGHWLDLNCKGWACWAIDEKESRHWWPLVAARGGCLLVSTSHRLPFPFRPFNYGKSGVAWLACLGRRQKRGSNMAPPSLAEVTIVWIQSWPELGGLFVKCG